MISESGVPKYRLIEKIHVLTFAALCLTIIVASNAWGSETWNVPVPTFVVTPSPFSSVQPRSKLPAEPEEFDEREVEAYYDWRNDMFFRRFDLTGKGDVDYMTARRTYKVWLDDFGTPVVITMADPLFYWIDLNGNGKFEQELGEMWSDPYEDGLTGNERPYDSSDLQQKPSEVPLWTTPDPSAPKLPPYNPQFGR